MGDKYDSRLCEMFFNNRHESYLPSSLTLVVVSLSLSFRAGLQSGAEPWSLGSVDSSVDK